MFGRALFFALVGDGTGALAGNLAGAWAGAWASA